MCHGTDSRQAVHVLTETTRQPILLATWTHLPWYFTGVVGYEE